MCVCPDGALFDVSVDVVRVQRRRMAFLSYLLICQAENKVLPNTEAEVLESRGEGDVNKSHDFRNQRSETG